MSFSVILPVGPGERELNRFRDAVFTVHRYEKENITRIVVVDDSLERRMEITQILDQIDSTYSHLINPRLGRGCGWGAGLAMGVLAALKHLAERDPGDFVLKMDTDSMMLRSCSEQIRELFVQNLEVGMIGAHRHFPHRPRSWVEEREPAPALEKLTRQITIWRRTHRPWPRIQCALFPQARRLRRLILDAMLAGYTLGEYCGGGTYAMRAEFVKEAWRGGFFENSEMWLPTPCGEDVVTALLVRRLGWEIKDAVMPGDPFGVGSPTLPFSPEEMKRKNYALVHPVNHKQEWPEEEMRETFRNTERV